MTTHPVLAISPLRQRLLDDMAMRRFGRETQHYYIRDVERFATWLGRSPHTATAEEVRSFQIEQQEAGMPVPTMNMMVSALRFFFTQTLDRPDLSRKLEDFLSLYSRLCFHPVGSRFNADPQPRG